MISLFLLLVAWGLFPSAPVIAALAFCGAVYGARGWSGKGEDALALFVFYGALLSCIWVWFQ